MRIIEEAFAAHTHTDTGEEGWIYRICVEKEVTGRGLRKLYCKRWVSCQEANGWWYEDKGQAYLRDVRERLCSHIRERAELSDLDNRWQQMTAAPPKRMVWTPPEAGRVAH